MSPIELKSLCAVEDLGRVLRRDVQIPLYQWAQLGWNINQEDLCAQLQETRPLPKIVAMLICIGSDL